MSQEGYDKLVAELKRLESVERPKASAAIAEARDKGDLSENSEYDAAKEALGNLHLAQGNYAQAVQDFDGIYSNSAALAQIMNKDYQAAKNTLQNIKNGDGTTEYLKAVEAARMGDSAAAQAAKAKAAQLDAKWAQYGTNDLELLNLLK